MAKEIYISSKRYRCFGGPWDGEYIFFNLGQTSTLKFKIKKFCGYYSFRYSHVEWVQL